MARVYVGTSLLHVPYGLLPEDSENSDREYILQTADKLLDKRYPAFEPEIVYGIDKEYFLPALKVLTLIDGKYFSPGYEVEWVDMCLKAECRSNAYRPQKSYHLTKDNDGNTIIAVPNDLNISEMQVPVPHPAPDEECECGIYGSVNLEEIRNYLDMQHQSFVRNRLYIRAFTATSIPSEPQNVLCLIEPSPDAKVILCRKGWKASAAFVSEIVGETLHIDQASNLLSIAWKRTIDIRRLYENR